MGGGALSFKTNPDDTFFFFDKAMDGEAAVGNDGDLGAVALFEEDFGAVHPTDFFVAGEHQADVV